MSRGREHRTGLIITGDASGGIRAMRATESELGKLNQGFNRGSRYSRQFNQDVNASSQGLAVLRRAAAPIAGVIAGMFAANTLQSQIDWGDQLQKTNLRIGASTEALSQYNYVAKLSGVEFNQLTTAWQRQTRRIAEAAAGTGVAVAALDRLNLSAQELNQLAPEDQFERIAEAMQGVENSSERVRLAQQLWDSEGVKLVQIVNSGTDAIAAMRAEADALGLTISQDTANAMASYNDEVDRLKFAAQGVSQTLLSELVPAMTAGLQNANAFIQEVGGAEVVVGHLTDGAQVLAALLAGRYAGAFATATAAKLAATQQSIAYQMALARMAGVSATAAGAQASLAAATRGAGAAMALVGGPLGAAMIAGGAIYYFREELGLVAPKVQTATERVDDMTSALDANSEAALKNARAMLEAEQQFQKFRQIQLAMEVNRQRQIVADEQRQWDAVGGQQAFGMGQASESQQALRDLQVQLMDTRNAIEAAGGSVAEIDSKLEALKNTTRDVITPTTDLGDTTSTTAAAAREAAKQTTTLANSYENLLDRIQPNRRAARQYAQDVGTLNLALATGRMTTVQYMQAMGMLQESFQAAQRETENTANASEDASQRIANSFLSWETVADNTLRRIDDSGQSLWLGLIDGSESALDTVKRGFQQTLAEIAHMLTTQKLTFQVAGMMGLDTTGMPGGGGFNLGSLGSLYSSATKLPYVGDAISGIGSALGFGASAAAPIGYASGFGAAAATGTYTGFAGSAAAGAAAAGGGGLMGAASAAMPWVGGALLVDNVLGLGITDGIVKGISSLFGGGKTAPKFELATVGQDVDPGRRGLFENYGEGVYSRGALGTVGFYDPNTARLEETFDGFDNAKAFLDGITALDNAMVGAVANLDNGAEKTQAMASAAQAVRLNAGDAAGIANQLATRTLAVVDVLDGDFSASLRGLGLDAEQLTGRVVQAANAMQLLDASSDRLNLQFDASAAGALRAADSIAQMAGGVDQLASLQNSYYTAFFSDAERAADLQQDVAASLRAMGLALPSTYEGFRQLVEQQNRLTESGQRNYVQLLQLAGPFDRLQTLLEQTGNGVDVFADRLSQLNGEISTLENEVRNAYAAFEKQSFDQQLQLLGLMGDEQAALALQRERELQGIDPLLQETQRRIWAMEDEAAAQQDATRAGQEYARSLAQVNDQLSSAFNGISQWVDQQSATAGTPGMNLTEAGDQFARQLVLAQSGDRNALQSITQYAEQYLAAGEAMYASGGAFQRIQGDVLDALKDLPDQISAEEYIAEEVKQALREQTQGISTQLGDVLRGDNPSNIASNLAGHFATLAGGIDGVLTREQLAIVMSGKATDAELRAIMRAVDLNGDGVMDGLESVIIQSLPTDAVLGTVLRNKMNELDKNQLTHAQIRSALSPIATDAEISRLIRKVDANGDGIITQQELANQRLSGLAIGIGSTLKPMFDSIDLDTSGLIDWNEFYGAFQGLASDEELRRIFAKLDEDGSGTINRLEALNRSNEGTEANTDSLEKQARSQLRELNGLVSEMARSTDQFVGLNTTMVSLRKSINALGVANAERARIERERAAAERAERNRIERERAKAQRASTLESNAQNSLASMQEWQQKAQETVIGNAPTQTLSQRRVDNLTGVLKRFAGDDQLLSGKEMQRSIDYAQGQAQWSQRDRAFFNRSARAAFYESQYNKQMRAAAGLTGETYSGRVDFGYLGYQEYLNSLSTTERARLYLERYPDLTREQAAKYGQEYGPEWAKYHYNRWGKNEGRLFANGGWTGPGGKWDPAGIVHAEEFVVRSEVVKQPGVRGMLEALNSGRAVGSTPTPRAAPLPSYPLLGNSEIVETLRDLKREVAELRRENARLQSEGNRHAAAAVAVQQAGFNGQINEQKKSNLALDDMSAAARLEASR